MQTITREELEKRVGEVVGVCINETTTVEGKLGLFGIVGIEEKGERVLKILPKGEERFYIDQLVNEGFYSLGNESIIKIKAETYKVSL